MIQHGRVALTFAFCTLLGHQAGAQERVVFPAQDGVRCMCLAFSHDSNVLATGFDSGRIRLYKLSDAKELR
jgi:hypothetical protein